MKRIAFFTIVGVALLVLATGAWIADGLRAVRGTDRRRRRAERAAERHPLGVGDRSRKPLPFPEGEPPHFVVA